uniref:Uncharacterized protein n=1 Tax=Vibrio parahaemolyticus TaxID=670 RepID=A0A0C5GX56_VIBPH|nr:hypothetical protein pVPH1_0091 [Vibrio parahaemolyticus]
MSEIADWCGLNLKSGKQTVATQTGSPGIIPC